MDTKKEKKILDNSDEMCFIDVKVKTVEAEIKSQAHLQRVPPQAESGMKSGAANGPLRAGGNADGQSIF